MGGGVKKVLGGFETAVYVTSNQKIMLRESDAVTKGVMLKRKVKEAGGVACVPTKKVRLELMSPKLKRVGGGAK